MGPWRIARTDGVASLVAGLALPEVAADLVFGYLTRLDAALPVPSRMRRGVLAEVGDGIACAVDSRMADGAAADDAARAALAELGPADDLETAMAAEIAPLSAHRTGLLLLVGGPMSGWRGSRRARRRPGPWNRIEHALRAMPLYPGLLALAVPAALLALAGAGPLSRRAATGAQPTRSRESKRRRCRRIRRW